MSVEAPLPLGRGDTPPGSRRYSCPTGPGRGGAGGRVLRPQMSCQAGAGGREGVVTLPPAVLRRAASLREGQEEPRRPRPRQRHSVAFIEGGGDPKVAPAARRGARYVRGSASLDATREEEGEAPRPEAAQDAQGSAGSARGPARGRPVSWARELAGGNNGGGGGGYRGGKSGGGGGGSGGGANCSGNNSSSRSGGGGGVPFMQYYDDDDGSWRRRSLGPASRCDPCDHCFKVMLIGDSCVGKTCLLTRFKDGAFLSGTFISTVGIDFRNKVVTVDGSKVKLQIWDTAGQERFRSVTHAYYRDAHALLLLYDVMNKNSYDNTRAWLAEVHEYAQDDVVIMLIGNKCDVNGDRVVRREDGERLAREYNVAFMETSAKTGLNVDLAFLAVARQLKARKSNNPVERKFNVAEYVRQEAKTEGCACNVG
ncbi:EF-hand calcium-binding domain-containing protein 4B-like [Eriocheir sinensis]|uniref:EF-hand calcium-binding domain-containing protein 4B-like n=1 Tax=Eriocheir sinensis TaxID=95602 RepID=UPI0021C7994E|nr:EF-hand calcium-binding domain-containing protein 4B-like [Eriocheir sinensis]XP_050697528.1 EF-hand calcium-binding domain-containing protein 4B-like [Eriocheir sinensis]XP_050697529.1 EF-hand calcium-binding domain-containing protein 4B-like [Eriocheir sinensis]XP_050697530.1 EF-hand calcium-binding domain-containing protein 4B-like [Eriocheir sinensis]XP_050697531.1 EF-hand calcium-binding domain-containing protein 4B-like [Eriocheir sinensis]XP_050697532.1 EF-hand calcium-binding domain